jgi:uncharacterized protein YcfJ
MALVKTGDGAAAGSPVTAAGPGPAWQRLVQGLDRTAEPLARLWTAARARLTDEQAKRLDDGLRGLRAVLLNEVAGVVFGGHFSCGKSSLLNMLIGRPLLPTGDFPETGVPCTIRLGRTDRIQAVTSTGQVTLPFSTEAISHYVSLINDRGDYRASVQDVRLLQVNLTSGGLPEGAMWVDSPGINDTPEMTRRARDTAAWADVLVWVVNTRQPLAEVEQAFLREHVAEHGPAGVVFVVNAFLSSDDAQTWSRFLADPRGYGYHRQRIIESGVTGAGIALVMATSARAAAENPTGFGAPQVRLALNELTGADTPLIRATRAHRVAHRLDGLAEPLAALGEAERAAVTARQRARSQAESAERNQRARFRRQLEQRLNHRFVPCTDATNTCVAQIRAEIGGQPLQRDGSYATRLSAALTKLSQQLTGPVTDEINACAREASLAPLTAAATASLRTLLRPPPISVAVPNTAIDSNGSKVGAVIGGILGSILTLHIGVGTAIGAAAGGAIGGGSEAKAALDKDRSAAIANLTAAGEAAAAHFRALPATILSQVTDARATPSALPPSPDRTGLDALAALHTHLTSTLAAMARAAVTEAEQAMTQ